MPDYFEMFTVLMSKLSYQIKKIKSEEMENKELALEFKDEDEARTILELARYANVHTQLPLTVRSISLLPRAVRANPPTQGFGVRYSVSAP